MNPHTGDIQEFDDPAIAAMLGYTIPLSEKRANILRLRSPEDRIAWAERAATAEPEVPTRTHKRRRFKERRRVSR